MKTDARRAINERYVKSSGCLNRPYEEQDPAAKRPWLQLETEKLEITAAENFKPLIRHLKYDQLIACLDPFTSELGTIPKVDGILAL